MKFKLLLVVVSLLAVFLISGPALAMTEQERQTLIAQITAQIAQLTQQLNQMIAEQQGTTIPTPTDWCHSFNIDLDTGDTGSEVVALQTAFQKQGFIISASEIQNQQFGSTTGQAVKDFKVKYSSQIVTSGTTKVADRTRGILNQLYGCATVQPTTCNTNWSCGSWSTCTNNQQTRTCTDLNSCGVTTNKPAVTQSCTTACVSSCTGKTCGADNGCGGKCQTGTCPTGGMTCSNGQCICTSYTNTNWSCTNWSSCISSKQTRTCSLPVGSCYKALTVKPAVTQSCGSSTTPTPNTNCIGEHGKKNLPSATNIYTQSCCSGLVYVVNPSHDFNYLIGTGTCELPSFPRYDGQACTTDSGCQSGHCVSNVCSATVAPVCNTTSGVPSSIDLKVNGSDGPISGGNYDANGFEYVTLSWTSSNVACCKVSGDWNISGTGFNNSRNTSGSESQPISAQHPGSSYTFTISCTGANNSTVSDSTVVNVNAPFVELKIADSGGSNPVDGSLTLTSGYDAGVLQWSTTNSTSCTAATTTSCSTAGGNTCPSSTIPLIASWMGTKAVSGSQHLGNLSNIYTGIVLPLTFTLTCTGPNGTSSDSVTLNIAKPLTVGMTGSVSNSASGKSVLLSWSSTGATSCRGLDDWSGTKATSGSETVGPFPPSGTNVSKTFTIFCEGPLGTVRDTKPFIIETAPF